MPRHRKPRPPTASLPATFDQAEDRIIEETVLGMRGRLEEVIGSEASHRFFETDFLRRLHEGTGSLDAGIIVDMARSGHPPADHALRHFIQQHMEADRFQQMPTSVREYARWSLANPPLQVGYASQAPQTVNDFNRDVAIGLLFDMVVMRWPATPQFYSSSRRRSAAAIIGKTFGLGEDHVRRIVKSRGELCRKIAEFLVGTSNLTNGPAPFVR